MLPKRPLDPDVELADVINADIGRDEPGTLVLLDQGYLQFHPKPRDFAQLAALKRAKVAILGRSDRPDSSESLLSAEYARAREVLARHPKLAAAPVYLREGQENEDELILAAAEAEARATPGLRRVVALLRDVGYYPNYYTDVHYELARLGLTFTPYNLLL